MVMVLVLHPSTASSDLLHPAKYFLTVYLQPSFEVREFATRPIMIVLMSMNSTSTTEARGLEARTVESYCWVMEMRSSQTLMIQICSITVRRTRMRRTRSAKAHPPRVTKNLFEASEKGPQHHNPFSRRNHPHPPIPKTQKHSLPLSSRLLMDPGSWKRQSELKPEYKAGYALVRPIGFMILEYPFVSHRLGSTCPCFEV